MLRIVTTAVLFLFATASTSAEEKACVLGYPDEGGSLPEGLLGCESTNNMHRYLVKFDECYRII